MLYHLTGAITNSIDLKRNANSNPEFLTVITKPLTQLIVQVIEKKRNFFENKKIFVDFSLIEKQ